VEIEADDGGLELVLTFGALTRRFDRDQVDELEHAIEGLTKPEAV
jgi:hypothetical protein